MQNDKSKFKKEFKRRLYEFVLKMIEFIDRLPNDNNFPKVTFKKLLPLRNFKKNL